MRKTVIIAILAASIGYSLMSFIMTATPLQIVNVCKLGDSASATVIQWHVIAMFAPSFFTGSIINFLGNRKVMLMGVLLYVISICVGVMGQTIEYFWISLFLCGLGWNFLYVGGSDIIAKSALPEERAKVQGVTDFIIFIFVASGSFLAGSLHNNLGWEIMMFYTSIPISILFLSIVLLIKRNKGNLGVIPRSETYVYLLIHLVIDVKFQNHVLLVFFLWLFLWHLQVH